MARKPPKLNLPQDPVKIGENEKGPIWLQLQDLIPTPDQNLERWDKTLENRNWKVVDQMAKLVLVNATTFIQETVVNTAGKTGLEIMQSGDHAKFAEWFIKAGYEVIQDGLTTVVKVRGKVIRDMTAAPAVEPRYRDAVARQVNKLVRKGIR